MNPSILQTTKYEPESPLTYAYRFARWAEHDSSGPYHLRSVAKAFLEAHDWNRAIKTLLQISSPRDGLSLFSISQFGQDVINRFPEFDQLLLELLLALKDPKLNPTPKWRSEPDLYSLEHTIVICANSWNNAGRPNPASKAAQLVTIQRLRELLFLHLKADFSLIKIQSIHEWDAVYAQASITPIESDSRQCLLNLLATTRKFDKQALEPALLLRLLETLLWWSNLTEAKGGNADFPYAEAFAGLSLVGREDLAKKIVEAFSPNYPSPSFRSQESVNLETIEQSLQASWLNYHCETAPMRDVEEIDARVKEPQLQARYLTKLACRYESLGNNPAAEICWGKIETALTFVSGYTKTCLIHDLAEHLTIGNSPETAFTISENLADKGIDFLVKTEILIGVARRQFELGRSDEADQNLLDAISRIPQIEPFQNRSNVVQKLCLCLAKNNQWDAAFDQFRTFFQQEINEEARACYCRIALELSLALAKDQSAKHLSNLGELASLLKVPPAF